MGGRSVTCQRYGSGSGDYSLRVRLNYRHLPPVLFDKIGIARLKHLLEVVVIDEYESVISVTP